MVEKKQNGFTIIELLVAVGIGGALSLVAFYLMYFFTSNYHAIQSKVDTERSLVQAVYNLQRALSMAIELDDVTGPVTGPIPVGGRGKIRVDFNGSTMGGAPGTYETIALFLRERGGFQAAPQGLYGPTAIFYKRPTQGTSGLIFLDVSDVAAKSPSYDNVFFDHVVEFSTSNPVRSPVNPVDPQRLTSLEFSITMRSFLENPTFTKRWNFCPEADMPSCPPASGNSDISWKDINRKFRVTFSNQIIMSSNPRAPNIPGSPYERTFGQLYLFPSVF